MINVFKNTVVFYHYVALIGIHGIVRITHCRWRCGSLVAQRPLPLFLSMTYHCYCLWRIIVKGVREKTDGYMSNKTDKPSIPM